MVTNYINPRNIAACTKEENVRYESHRMLSELISEYKQSIEVGNEVVLLSTMKIRFMERAKNHGVKVSERNFKRHLINAWPYIAITPQHGKSDLVCAGHIQVGDALHKAFKLHQNLTHSSFQ